MQLNYAVNSGKSYTAAQMVKGVIPKINHQIAKEVTRNYTITLFDFLKKMENGLNTAKNSAAEAQKDARDLANGSKEFNKGMKQLASSSLLFKNGLNQAAAGAEEMRVNLNTLHTGVRTLDDGLAELKQNQDKLHRGITDAAKGSQELDKKIQQLLNGEQTFNNRINSMISLLKQAGDNAGSSGGGTIGTWANLFGKLDQQLDDIQTVQQSLIDSTKSTLTNIQSIQDSEHKKIQNYVASSLYLSPHAQKKTIGSGLQTIEAQSDQSMEKQKKKLEAKLDKSQQQLDDLKKTQDNLDSLSAGTQAMLDRQTQALLTAGGWQIANDPNTDSNAYNTEIRQALSRFQKDSNQVAKGTAALAKATGKMAASMQTLQDGSKKIQQGTDQLKNGSSVLNSGTGQLAAAGNQLTGLQHLSAGGGALNSGASKLADSSGRLNDGSNQLQTGISRFHQHLQNQSSNLSGIHTGQPQADRFAEPANSAVNDAHYVHN
ncbi:hypothetical protein QS257_20425 [Terrilactibacillus sp. S3-3]|nr:hypothetical protein QS257_20425 [Terrilactibacillus sp. S3-3]